ncbi:MAG: penicillin-binding protein [Rickettsiales bacterium]|nr:MAG: penicillin-binding protein [Rickettsiales bacterium]
MFCVLYPRIILLKLRRAALFRIKKLSNSLHEFKWRKLYRSLYIWDLSYSQSRMRMHIVIGVFAFVFFVISARLIMVATSEYTSYRRANEVASGSRLDIVDRNNNLLAVNLPGASLYANPRKIIDQLDAANKLSRLIPELKKKELLRLFKKNKSFVWIKRDISPGEHEKIYNLGIAGLGFEREQKRIYPYGNLLSHVVGYVGRDLNGLAGLEKYFEKFLTGQKEKEDRRKLGSSLKLSIDVRVQNILSAEIDKGIKKFSAKGASGIIVDPNNGEVIAMVSKPDFNPHHPGDARPKQLFNTVTQGVYEMGSGMKALTVAIGLDSGTTSMHDVYDLSYMKVGGKVIKDTHQMKGWHSVPHIFMKSSNIGVTQIMLEIGREKLSDYFRKIGFLDRLQIELPERARPLFQPFSRWSDLSLTTMSYGYGFSESPAHFMQAMIPVMNGGIIYPLTLLRRDEGEVLTGERVFKESTSNSMRQLMRLTVARGTGKKAEVKGYYVGGKTGTAYIAHAGKYDKTRRISSFFGVMPASSPKYMIYVVYNEPKGIKETFGWAGGGWTGAPTVGAVLSRMAALYGLSKLDKNSKEVQELNNVEYKIENET